MTQLRKIAFVDRDGTIVKEPSDYQVDSLQKVDFVADVFSGLKALIASGYELVMVSNQDGLGTDSFPREDFENVHNFILRTLNSQGIQFAGIEICPHLPTDACSCRKPQLGLVIPYLHNLDKEASVVIGDRESDVLLAEKMGIRAFRISEDVGWNQVVHTLIYSDRRAQVSRSTSETQIVTSVVLDGRGSANISTGLKFFDHMLEQLARHSGISMEIACQGDLAVDEHHTVEDVALAIGECLSRALGDRRGIKRYGFLLPMDESLAQVALDLGGRPQFEFSGEFYREKVGDLPTEMVPHFFKSFCDSLRANMHLSVKGDNTHHMVEACFKCVARALGEATRKSGSAIPSTKGVL